MNYKKRFTCIFLILCYVAGCVISPANISFKSFFDVNADSGVKIANNQGASSVTDFLDVKQDDWFYSYLENLIGKAVINGKSKTEFDPDGEFSFAECGAVITRYLALDSYAGQKLTEIKNKSPQTQMPWYCGYLQVMHELGIFDESMGLYSISDGYISCVFDSVCNSSMKRHEFACAIAKSFELNGNLRAKNIYSEVSGLGHDFIIGGYYIDSYFDDYSALINDFEAIPSSSREYVLKLYYNGIFNGDTSGNFNPDSCIKRSEMAKVICTIMDFSMRKCLITDYCPAISEDKLFFDSQNVETLSYKYALGILQTSATGFDASSDLIKYVPTGTLPYGYAVDVYLYSYADDGLCNKVLTYGLSGGNVDGKGFEYDSKDGENLRAVMVLRNLKNNAKPEFTLNVSITDDGILTKSRISNI